MPTKERECCVVTRNHIMVHIFSNAMLWPIYGTDITVITTIIIKTFKINKLSLEDGDICLLSLLAPRITGKEFKPRPSTLMLVLYLNNVSQSRLHIKLKSRSQSEREKRISYINTQMWNLEKWYRWSHLQSRDRYKDMENKCTDIKQGGWDESRYWDWHIHTIDTMCKIDN